MFLGLDIGGTKTEIIALNQKGGQLFRTRFINKKTQKENIETIHSLIKKIEKKENCKGTLGIGIRGWVKPQHKQIRTSISWIGSSFFSEIENKLQKKVKVQNDAKCFALSESIDGAGKNFNDGFYLILGTGVGSGLIFNKKLYEGIENLSGEWGQMIFPWDEKDKKLKKYFQPHNKIENIISGPSFEEFYRKKTNSKNKISAKQIMEKYRQKNADAIFVYKNYINLLAKALSQIINVLMPPVIVFGGGMSNIQEIYKDLPKELEKFTLLKKSPILKKAKYGDSSGVRGAAWLCK